MTITEIINQYKNEISTPFPGGINQQNNKMELSKITDFIKANWMIIAIIAVVAMMFKNKKVRGYASSGYGRMRSRVKRWRGR